jgi:hypothetical protein
MYCTVIAPYGTVGDTRDAGGDALADGRKLEGGGVAWDLKLDDSLRADLEAVGAIIRPRSGDEFLSDVLGDDYSFDNREVPS